MKRISSRLPLISSSSRNCLVALGLAVLSSAVCFALPDPSTASFSIGSFSNASTLAQMHYVRYSINGGPFNQGSSGAVQAEPGGSSSATGTSYASLMNVNYTTTITLTTPASIGIVVDGSANIANAYATSTITLIPPEGASGTATATNNTDKENPYTTPSSLAVSKTVFGPRDTWVASGSVSASVTN